MSYYAANNTHSTESSMGFSNTWYVLRFPSKAMRDLYVGAATGLAAQSIKASEIKSFGGVSVDVKADGRFFEQFGDCEIHNGWCLDLITGHVVSQY